MSLFKKVSEEIIRCKKVTSYRTPLFVASPLCSKKLRLPEFLDSPHMKVVKLSALR